MSKSSNTKPNETKAADTKPSDTTEITKPGEGSSASSTPASGASDTTLDHFRTADIPPGHLEPTATTSDTTKGTAGPEPKETNDAPGDPHGRKMPESMPEAGVVPADPYAPNQVEAEQYQRQKPEGFVPTSQTTGAASGYVEGAPEVPPADDVVQNPALVAYTAIAYAFDGRNTQGREMKPWEELTDLQRAGFRSGLEAIGITSLTENPDPERTRGSFRPGQPRYKGPHQARAAGGARALVEEQRTEDFRSEVGDNTKPPASPATDLKTEV